MRRPIQKRLKTSVPARHGSPAAPSLDGRCLVPQSRSSPLGLPSLGRPALASVLATGVLSAAATARVAGEVALRVGLEPGQAARTLEPQGPLAVSSGQTLSRCDLVSTHDASRRGLQGRSADDDGRRCAPGMLRRWMRRGICRSCGTGGVDVVGAVNGSRAICAFHRDSRFGSVDSRLGRRACLLILSGAGERHLSPG